MKLRENAGKTLFFVPRTNYAFNKGNSLSEFPDVALNSNIQEFSLKGQRISWLKATILLSVYNASAVNLLLMINKSFSQRSIQLLINPNRIITTTLHLQSVTQKKQSLGETKGKRAIFSGLWLLCCIFHFWFIEKYPAHRSHLDWWAASDQGG